MNTEAVLLVRKISRAKSH